METSIETAESTKRLTPKQLLERLQIEVECLLAPLGYDVVSLEQTTAPSRGGTGRVLTLYIDFLNNNDTNSDTRRISLQDCITVNAAVDEFFETTPLLEGAYHLEVSSPGVERPLRRTKDFERFSGKNARLHTFRPLESEELENEKYWETHKRQKNFIGKLNGLTPEGTKVRMIIDGQTIAVPVDLISKAHLEFNG